MNGETINTTKLDNDPDDVMRLIAETIASVGPAVGQSWSKRIVLGIWAWKYLPLCDAYLRDFPISYIGFTTSYAKKFFAVPEVAFNILHASLIGPFGASFIRKAKSLNRPVYAWTVNDEKGMRWGIRKQLDGVVTDDPEKFLTICERWDAKGPSPSFSWREVWFFIKIQLLTKLYLWYFDWKFGLNRKVQIKGLSEMAKKRLS